MCGDVENFMFLAYRYHPIVPTIFEFASIFPILIYYVFICIDAPHDEFACFNRLPNSRYSIYQLSRYDLVKRKQEVDGIGAVKSYQ